MENLISVLVVVAVLATLVVIYKRREIFKNKVKGSGEYITPEDVKEVPSKDLEEPKGA